MKLRKLLKVIAPSTKIEITEPYYKVNVTAAHLLDDDPVMEALLAKHVDTVYVNSREGKLDVLLSVESEK